MSDEQAQVISHEEAVIIERSMRLACKIAVAALHWVREQADECSVDEDGFTVATGTFDEVELVGPVQAILREALRTTP